ATSPWDSTSAKTQSAMPCGSCVPPVSYRPARLVAPCSTGWSTASPSRCSSIAFGSSFNSAESRVARRQEHRGVGGAPVRPRTPDDVSGGRDLDRRHWVGPARGLLRVLVDALGADTRLHLAGCSSG